LIISIGTLSEDLEIALILFFIIDRLALKFTLIVYIDKGETDFMDIYRRIEVRSKT